MWVRLVKKNRERKLARRNLSRPSLVSSLLLLPGSILATPQNLSLYADAKRNPQRKAEIFLSGSKGQTCRQQSNLAQNQCPDWRKSLQKHPWGTTIRPLKCSLGWGPKARSSLGALGALGAPALRQAATAWRRSAAEPLRLFREKDTGWYLPRPKVVGGWWLASGWPVVG